MTLQNYSFLQINERGQIVVNGEPLSDTQKAKALLEDLEVSEGPFRAVTTSYNGSQFVVEAWSAPIVAHSIQPAFEGDSNSDWTLLGPYGSEFNVSLSDICLDEWDHFRGYTKKGIPFVLTPKATDTLLNTVDEYSDDSLTWKGKEYPTPLWPVSLSNENSTENFWSERYQSEDTPWDMGKANPALVQTLHQLKLTRQRILVLGCGSGHDAAFLAQQGHIVTAVDFSPNAIAKAKTLWETQENLHFICADAFHLGPEHEGQYDIIFEHTLYCAIAPHARTKLVNQWSRYLAPEGHLLGIFFVFDRKGGPPYGGSEFEIQKRLKGIFQFLFWTRWKSIDDPRAGTELVVYARKKEKGLS